MQFWLALNSQQFCLSFLRCWDYNHEFSVTLNFVLYVMWHYHQIIIFKSLLNSIFSGPLNLACMLCHEEFKDKRKMALGSWYGKYEGLPSNNSNAKPSFNTLSRVILFKVKAITSKLSQIRNPTTAPCFSQTITGSGGGLLGLRGLIYYPPLRSHLPLCVPSTLACSHPSNRGLLLLQDMCTSCCCLKCSLPEDPQGWSLQPQACELTLLFKVTAFYSISSVMHYFSLQWFYF